MKNYVMHVSIFDTSHLYLVTHSKLSHFILYCVTPISVEFAIKWTQCKISLLPQKVTPMVQFDCHVLRVFNANNSLPLLFPTDELNADSDPTPL